MYLVVSALSFVLLVIALVDIITHDDGRVNHLPKFVWILLVIILPLAGSILWFAVGRAHGSPIADGRFSAPRGRGSQQQRNTGGTAVRARTTEEQLADLDREIEFHEQEARIRQLEAELERRDGLLE